MTSHVAVVLQYTLRLFLRQRLYWLLIEALCFLYGTASSVPPRPIFYPTFQTQIFGRMYLRVCFHVPTHEKKNWVRLHEVIYIGWGLVCNDSFTGARLTFPCDFM
jgi:hypothetical protein